MGLREWFARGAPFGAPLSSVTIAITVLGLCLHGVLGGAGRAAAASADSSASAAIFRAPLEDLLRMEVSSPSRFNQPLMEAHNAVWVITAEDIRRAGVRSLPEALALAPGVYVAQGAGNNWTVTIGGFSLGSFSNKLLVLVDNVTVYSTLFGNVEWDLLPVTLAEIDRIEVIRNAAGVQYGANAVNGVVSIFTKAPGPVATGYARLEGGGQGVRAFQAGAEGASVEGGFRARVSGGSDEDNGLGRAGGDLVHDSQRLTTGAVRSVLRGAGGLSFSIDGRVRVGEYLLPEGVAIAEQRRAPELGILRLRADRNAAGGSDSYLQLAVVHNRIKEAMDGDWERHELSETLDAEFQHRLRLQAGGLHRLVIGGGDRSVEVEHVVLEGGRQDSTVANIFFLDEWRPAANWIISGGVKWEYNSLTDPTYPWRITVLWLPASRHSLRLGVSTAYRSPTLLEEREKIVMAGGTVQLLGNDALESETTLICEAGYRGEVLQSVFLDLSFGLKRYEGLIALVKSETSQGIEYRYFNDYGGEATARTFEAGLEARPADWLGISVAYGHVDIDVDGPLAAAQYSEETQPSDFGSLTVGTRLPGGFAADVAVRFTTGFADKVDEYWRLDARLAKSFRLASGDLELGLVGQNLLDPVHVETVNGKEIPRTWYGYLTLSF